jgi:hypothetical protein
MVQNNLVVFIDPYGLKVCETTIRVGHGTGGESPNNKFIADFDYLPCTRLGVVGCQMDKQNGIIPDEHGIVIPDENQIPGMPDSPEDRFKPGEINDTDIPGLTDQALAAALNTKTNQCSDDEGDCDCTSVSVRVICDSSVINADSAAFRQFLNFGNDAKVSTKSKCGRTFSVKCPSK